MKSIVLIVGIGQWDEYTKPLVESIHKHEPDSVPLIVDNGMNYCGLNNNKYHEIERQHFFIANALADGTFYDDHKPVSYAEAINHGLFILNEYPEWLIVVNNDVICDGPFHEYLEGLDEYRIYGNTLHYKHRRFSFPTPWIDGWIYAVPRRVLEAVGKWDERFKIAGFEDADYCFRAFEKGFKVEESKLPFTHLEEHIRKTFNNYPKHREDNMRYLIKKHNLRWK